MYYAFTTKAVDATVTGPSLLVSSGVHRLTIRANGVGGLSGIRSMSSLQVEPLRVSNMTGGGQDEYFRFQELWDSYPSSITTVIDTPRPLLAEELFNLIKRLPMVIVTVPAGNQRGRNGVRMPPLEPMLPTGTTGCSPVQHLLPGLLPLPTPPPPPQFNPGGEMIGPVGGAQPVFSVSNPFMTLAYENPFLQFGPVVENEPEVEAGTDGLGQVVGENPSPMPNSVDGVWQGNLSNPGTDISPYTGATEETAGLEWPPLQTSEGGRGRAIFRGRSATHFQGPTGRRRQRWDK